MNILMTERFLHSIGACYSGIEFAKRNGLIGIDVHHLLSNVQGDIHGCADFVRNAVEHNCVIWGSDGLIEYYLDVAHNTHKFKYNENGYVISCIITNPLGEEITNNLYELDEKGTYLSCTSKFEPFNDFSTDISDNNYNGKTYNKVLSDYQVITMYDNKNRIRELVSLTPTAKSHFTREFDGLRALVRTRDDNNTIKKEYIELYSPTGQLLSDNTFTYDYWDNGNIKSDTYKSNGNIRHYDEYGNYFYSTIRGVDQERYSNYYKNGVLESIIDNTGALVIKYQQ